MIRKLAPANWSVRGWIIFLILCGLIGILTACTPSKDTELNDCIVSVGTVYVSEYGPLDETTWEALRTDCTDQVERGEWK